MSAGVTETSPKKRGRPRKDRPGTDLSVQQIKLVNGLMKGNKAYDAMKDAGYSEGSCKDGQGNIIGHPAVQAELTRRKQQMIERNQITEDWIVQRLARIADASIGDILEIDRDGKPFLNWEKMTPSLKATIKKFEQTEFTDGRGAKAGKAKKTKVELDDKLRALELLMKVLGIGKETVEVKVESDSVSNIWAAHVAALKNET